MANNVNLLQIQELVTTAIMHVANNNPGAKLKTMGGIMALRSPAFAQIRNEINPLTNTDSSKLAWNTAGARPFPQIKSTYKPLNARSVQTTRTTKTAGTGVKPTAGASFTVDFDKYIEPVDAVKKNLSSDMAAINVDDYYKKWVGGSLSIAQISNANNGLIGRIALDLWTRGAKDILPALDTQLLTSVFAKVGTNPAYPAVVTPTAAAPIVEVNGFVTINGVVGPDPKVWSTIQNTKDISQMTGRPVLIGGQKWLEWHRMRKIATLNTTSGIDYQAVYQSVEHEFYYDAAADTIFGQDVAVLIEPNTVGFQEFAYADSPILANNTTHNDMYYTSFNAIFSQFNPQQAGYSNIDPAVSLMMDLRIKESNGTNDFPVSEFVPSIAYGLWTRPTGYLTTDTGDLLKTYTGICALKIL